jgi:hypothetical protein
MSLYYCLIDLVLVYPLVKSWSLDHYCSIHCVARKMPRLGERLKEVRGSPCFHPVAA